MSACTHYKSIMQSVTQRRFGSTENAWRASLWLHCCKRILVMNYCLLGRTPWGFYNQRLVFVIPVLHNLCQQSHLEIGYVPRQLHTTLQDLFVSIVGNPETNVLIRDPWILKYSRVLELRPLFGIVKKWTKTTFGLFQRWSLLRRIMGAEKVKRHN